MTTQTQIPEDMMTAAEALSFEFAVAALEKPAKQEIAKAIYEAVMAEREKAAALAESVEIPASDIRMKMALDVAARAIRRGRHLTAEEKLENVRNFLASAEA